MLYFFCQYESMPVLKETHSKWHMVTDYNRVWRSTKLCKVQTLAGLLVLLPVPCQNPIW